MNGFLRHDSHRSGFGRVTYIRVDLSVVEIFLEKCDDEGVRSISFFLNFFCVHNCNQFIQQAASGTFLCLCGTTKISR